MGPHIEDIPKEIQMEKVLKEEKREIIETVKEDVDETVILARLRTQAKVLQELDGELPEGIDKFLNNIEKTQSLSLVAGYGEESDEEPEEQEEKPMAKTLFPIPEVNITQSSNGESTLFPITQPIDISQFSVPKEEEVVVEKSIVQPPSEENSLDTKLFKRKKRIAFDVLPTIAEKKLKVTELEERRGLGFKVDPESTTNDDKGFISFQKGGVAFTKSDEKIQPTIQEEIVDNLDQVKEIVSEKVSFLCEGKNEVSAVQIMSIQLNVSKRF